MTTTNEDPAALDDLAAELDDDDNDPEGDDRGADPPAEPTYYAGTVTTGPAPYPGHQLVSRYPSGVLLIDKAHDRAWVLDYAPPAAGPGPGPSDTGVFTCRDTAGVPVDPDGRWRAAEGDTFDVRAYDPAFAGDELPGTCATPGCDDDGGEAE